MAGIKLSIKKEDLAESKPVKVEVKGKSIMVVMVKGEVFAIDSACSHRGGPLEQGKMDGYEVSCPWHGALYDVRTGRVNEKTNWGKFQTPYKVSADASGTLSIEV